MKYKGYDAIVKYSDEDETFVGEVINTQDILVFDGCNIAEVKASFYAVVDEYLDDCKAEKKQPNKAFSGQFVMRIKPELHRELFAKAKQAGLSLNTFISKKLSDTVSEH